MPENTHKIGKTTYIAIRTSRPIELHPCHRCIAKDNKELCKELPRCSATARVDKEDIIWKEVAKFELLPFQKEYLALLDKQNTKIVLKKWRKR